ncbi:MAG: VWA domain-containing protein [Pseudomonadota bacterium]
MSFEHPWLLLALLLPLAGAVALRRLAGREGPPRWPALRRIAVAGDRVRDVGPHRVRPALLLTIALALAIVALARPQWGEQADGSFRYTREVVIALDLSRSMLTEDVPPSRLEVAKTLVEQLLDGLQGENVALVVFAGTAFVQVPLGPDYQIVRAFMPSLDTDYLPQGGSDYGRMLDAALDGFGAAPDRDRYLFVLSDGESSTEGWESRLDELAKRDVHAITIGVGTPEGGFVPNVDEGGYLSDGAGQAVQSRLMPATLQALARRTNGRYLEARALPDADAVRELIGDTVETGRRGRTAADAAAVETERFQWLLLPAVLLAFLALYREFPPRPSPRAVRRAGALAVVLLVAGVGAAPHVRAHFDDYAGFEVRRVFDGDPIPRLRAIVEHLAEYGYDAFDLRLMVEESIRYGVDSQRTAATIAPGVLRDAIEATHRGEKLDPSVADWGYYRAQLSEMLAAQSALVEERSEAPDTIMDEENDTPIVIGDGTQQFANDSFGLGASSRTDATLGEIEPASDVPLPRGRKPTPPQNARAAGVRPRPDAGGGSSSAIMKFARERLDEAAQADSPGRLHLLLADDPPPADPNAVTW